MRKPPSAGSLEVTIFRDPFETGDEHNERDIRRDDSQMNFKLNFIHRAKAIFYGGTPTEKSQGPWGVASAVLKTGSHQR